MFAKYTTVNTFVETRRDRNGALLYVVTPQITLAPSISASSQISPRGASHGTSDSGSMDGTREDSCSVNFDNIEVCPNAVHRLSLSARFRHCNPANPDVAVMTSPRLAISIADSKHAWRHELEPWILKSMEHPDKLIATFFIPPQVHAVDVIVTFSLDGYSADNAPCEVALFADESRLVPVDGLRNIERQWTTDVPQLRSMTTSTGVYNKLHTWFDAVYLLHSTKCTALYSQSVRQQLHDAGVQFIYIEAPSEQVEFARIEYSHTSTHQQQCSSCFVRTHGPGLNKLQVGMDSTPGGTMTADTTRAKLLQIATANARQCGYDRVLLLSDHIALRNGWVQQLQTYGNPPDQWRVLFLGATLPRKLDDVRAAHPHLTGSTLPVLVEGTASYYRTPVDISAVGALTAVAVADVKAFEETFLKPYTASSSISLDEQFVQWMKSHAPPTNFALCPRLMADLDNLIGEDATHFQSDTSLLRTLTTQFCAPKPCLECIIAVEPPAHITAASTVHVRRQVHEVLKSLTARCNRENVLHTVADIRIVLWVHADAWMSKAESQETKASVALMMQELVTGVCSARYGTADVSTVLADGSVTFDDWLAARYQLKQRNESRRTYVTIQKRLDILSRIDRLERVAECIMMQPSNDVILHLHNDALSAPRNAGCTPAGTNRELAFVRAAILHPAGNKTAASSTHASASVSLPSNNDRLQEHKTAEIRQILTYRALEGSSSA